MKQINQQDKVNIENRLNVNYGVICKKHNFVKDNEVKALLVNRIMNNLDTLGSDINQLLVELENMFLEHYNM